MEEQRTGHKQKKKEFWLRVGQKERRGMVGVEWLRKKEEGRVEVANEGDMMVYKSLVAD